MHCSPERHGLPGLPSEADQVLFTARSGTSNLRQAFSFYAFCRELAGELGPEDQVLDFGCGWGRVSRFWLRDVPPERLWCSDVNPYALGLLRETGLEARVVQHGPLPPVPELADEMFRVICAYSVFSHLPPDTARRWATYLGARLVPEGVLVITTRGRDFIDALRGQRHALDDGPSAEAIEPEYERGEFVYIDIGQGEHYGEALIPERAAGDLGGNGLRCVAFHERLPDVGQAVAVYRPA